MASADVPSTERDSSFLWLDRKKSSHIRVRRQKADIALEMLKQPFVRSFFGPMRCSRLVNSIQSREKEQRRRFNACLETVSLALSLCK